MREANCKLTKFVVKTRPLKTRRCCTTCRFLNSRSKTSGGRDFLSSAWLIRHPSYQKQEVTGQGKKLLLGGVRRRRAPLSGWRTELDAKDKKAAYVVTFGPDLSAADFLFDIEYSCCIRQNCL